MGRASGGSLARAAGEIFEGCLDSHHTIAIQQGLLAWIRHVSPRVRWIGKGPRARPQIVGLATADYVGQIASGKALVLEAKSRRVVDGPLYAREIEPQQRSQLDACALHDGLALLAVEFREEALPTARFVVPWSDVPWKVLRTASSISAEDLAGWEMVGPTYLRKFVV